MKDLFIATLIALVVACAFQSLGQMFGLVTAYGPFDLGTKVPDPISSHLFCQKDDSGGVTELNVTDQDRAMKYGTDIQPGKGCNLYTEYPLCGVN